MEKISKPKALSRNELRKLIGGSVAPEQQRHCGENCGSGFYCVDAYCNKCSPMFLTYVCSVI